MWRVQEGTAWYIQNRKRKQTSELNEKLIGRWVRDLYWRPEYPCLFCIPGPAAIEATERGYKMPIAYHVEREHGSHILPIE